jgi:plasmid stability protein
LEHALVPPVDETPPALELPPVDEMPPAVELPPVVETPPALELPPVDEMPPAVRDEFDCSDCDAIIDCMANITIRGLIPEVKERLRVRAARHGRSMEEEARVILGSAVTEGTVTPIHLADSIRQRFEVLGGVELELPPREPQREPPRPR